jgi:DNA-binding NarL/FixJ family response regulator
VAGGVKWIPREIATRLASRKLSEEITPRELQVQGQIARGLAHKEIGHVTERN